MSHAVCGAAIAYVVAPCSLRRKVTVVSSVCAMLPDLDAIGFRFGVAYGDLLGHRGLTHSILFAAAIALVATIPFRNRIADFELLQAWMAIFVASISHGILDAFTNGGLGVAFFSPFDERRIFFSVTPIKVSPLSVRALIGRRGMEVLRSEIIWVWLPSVLLVLIGRLVRCRETEDRNSATLAI
jgi:inner membrane protein